MRSREDQTRRLYLVMLAYRLLRRPLQQGHAYEWAYQKRTTIGEACRAIGRETLRSTRSWARERVELFAWNKDQVVAYLGLA